MVFVLDNEDGDDVVVDDDVSVGVVVVSVDDDGGVCSPRQAIYCWLSVYVAALVESITLLLLLAVDAFRRCLCCCATVVNGRVASKVANQ